MYHSRGSLYKKYIHNDNRKEKFRYCQVTHHVALLQEPYTLHDYRVDMHMKWLYHKKQGQLKLSIFTPLTIRNGFVIKF